MISTSPSIRIGARRSRLSLAQVDLVRDLLLAALPAARIEIEVFSTEGDRRLDTPLPVIGGKGVFTEELEQALMVGEIDLAVHSLKDLPVESRPGVTIGAIPARAGVTDALISQDGASLEQLPRAAVIGTSSLRRAAQLRRVRPDVRPVSIRGNVETRMRKLREPAEGLDAIVLACAGLERLQQLHLVSQVLPLDVMLPAPGQGALAVQCRDDAETVRMLAAIQDDATAWAATAERAFLAGLGGGCAAPVAAYAVVESGQLSLRGRVLNDAGTSSIDVSTQEQVESASAARDAGSRLAEVALSRGAGCMLENGE